VFLEEDLENVSKKSRLEKHWVVERVGKRVEDLRKSLTDEQRTEINTILREEGDKFDAIERKENLEMINCIESRDASDDDDDRDDLDNMGKSSFYEDHKRFGCTNTLCISDAMMCRFVQMLRKGRLSSEQHSHIIYILDQCPVISYSAPINPWRYVFNVEKRSKIRI
jgi:hypothetical protein